MQQNSWAGEHGQASGSGARRVLSHRPHAARSCHPARKIRAKALYKATVRFGFMETPDVPLALMRSTDCSSLCFDPMETTYFASRETIVARRHKGMPIWRDRLFGFMHRNAAAATDFFRIPTTRLVELGSPVEI